MPQVPAHRSFSPDTWYIDSYSVYPSFLRKSVIQWNCLSRMKFCNLRPRRCIFTLKHTSIHFCILKSKCHQRMAALEVLCWTRHFKGLTEKIAHCWKVKEGQRKYASCVLTPCVVQLQLSLVRGFDHRSSCTSSDTLRMWGIISSWNKAFATPAWSVKAAWGPGHICSLLQ